MTSKSDRTGGRRLFTTIGRKPNTMNPRAEYDRPLSFTGRPSMSRAEGWLRTIEFVIAVVVALLLAIGYLVSR